jgi:hypothetical protein
MMGTMTITGGPGAGSWRCPRCDADRAPEDDFCGRCGARRPGPQPAADGEPGGTAPARDRPAGFPVRRALILNGIIVAAVVLAVLLGGNGGPGAVRFEPAAWRCDGTERAWIAQVPATAQDLRIEWLTGGPAGEVRTSSTVPRVELEAYRQADAAFRVTSTATDDPACGLVPGVYTMAVRDAANGALLASGDVELLP